MAVVTENPSQHLTDEDLRLYRTKRMPDELRAGACSHMAGCAECLERFTATDAGIDSADVLASLNGIDKPWVAEAITSAESHLTYAEMRGQIENTLSGDERLAVDRHQRECGECRADIEALRAHLSRQASRPAVSRAATGVDAPEDGRGNRVRWLALAGAGFAGACAAALVFQVAVVAPLERRDAAAQTAALAQQARDDRPPALRPNTPTPFPGDAAKIASLESRLKAATTASEDAERRATAAAAQAAALHKALTTANLRLASQRAHPSKNPAVPETTQASLAAALTKTLDSGKFASFPPGSEIAFNTAGAPQNTTRGAGDVGLDSPVATVTALTPRTITFRWTNTSFADHFRVRVYDITDPARATLAASTAAEPDGVVASAQWVCPTRLPRGHAFSWTVIPIRGGLDINGATAHFRTADAKTASRYAQGELLAALSQVHDTLYDPAAETLQSIADNFSDLPEGAKAQSLLASLRHNRAGSAAGRERQ